MKNAVVLALTFIAQIVFAAEVKITPSTPIITPAEQIFSFPAVDWQVVEDLQDKGKETRDTTVMECDDAFYSIVELKLDYNFDDEKSGLEDVTIDSDGCAFEGYNTNKIAPTWLHFSGPNSKSGRCEIILQKERSGGKKPLKVVYEIYDAC